MFLRYAGGEVLDALRGLTFAAMWFVPTVALCEALPDVVDRVSASVVTVAVEGATDSAITNRNGQKANIVYGSGMVLTPDGFIITAAHVVNNAGKITVVFGDGHEDAAQLVGKDPLTAVAVLKVNPSKPPTPVRFANSDQVRRGQSIFSISSPYGLRGTVSSEIVAAVTRGAAGPYQMLQTDGPVRPGSGGSPVFNLNGEVVGMASANYMQAGKPTGIGFAITSNVVKDIAARLQRAGTIERGYVGLRLRKPKDREASALGLPHGQGLVVDQVLDGGPSVNAGINPGDAIATLDGRPIGDLSDFVRSIFDLAPKTQVTLNVSGKTGRRDVQITVARLPDAPVAAPASASAAATKSSEIHPTPPQDCVKYIASAGITVSTPCEE
jgi:serine protease Do